VFRLPKDYLSPKLVDDFWQRAREAPITHAPAGGRARPQLVSAADASVTRSLKFLHTLPSVTISLCEGEVDFDLLGLVLVCKYRICTPNTTFINRMLRRSGTPGSATPWFLSRLSGG
jgi:enoyl-CoA hydratase/carnithine racemase